MAAARSSRRESESGIKGEEKGRAKKGANKKGVDKEREKKVKKVSVADSKTGMLSNQCYFYKSRRVSN